MVSGKIDKKGEKKRKKRKKGGKSRDLRLFFLFKPTGRFFHMHSVFYLKGNLGYCPCAPFLRRETGKLSGSRLLTISKFASIQFIDRLRSDGFSAFSGQHKITKICTKYLLTHYYK